MNRDFKDLLLYIPKPYRALYSRTANQEADKTSEPPAGENRPQSEKRDWSGALALVAEAQEAVRLSNERTAVAEQYALQLDQHYREKIKELQGRILAAERQIEAADLRTNEAEEWFEKFKGAIDSSFGISQEN